MCVQYWPASKELEETYGGISISIMQEEELANFHIRTFRLFKKEGDVSFKNSNRNKGMFKISNTLDVLRFSINERTILYTFPFICVNTYLKS